jgi:putative SOS response-associated peptidase YedK
LLACYRPTAPPDGQAGIEQGSCAILTRAAAGRAAEVHDRMPVVLSVAMIAGWTDQELLDADQVANLLREGATEDFIHYPVNTRVNSMGQRTPQA